ncbi:hypothetical protein QTP88_021112 [Uroleucon formosanum]
MESHNLNYIRLNQRDLLAKAYQGLMDHVNQRLHIDPMAVGRRIILPSTFTTLKPAGAVRGERSEPDGGLNRRLQDVDRARAACLAAVEDLLRVHGKSPGDYGLPLADPRLLEPLEDDVLFQAIDAAARWTPQVDALNAEQRTVYDRVMSAVDDRREVSKTFFIDGPGGTGKTTLYGCLIWLLRRGQSSREVLCVAFTQDGALDVRTTVRYADRRIDVHRHHAVRASAEDTRIICIF